MPTESDRVVVLAGGLTVRVEPILLLLDLEARGFKLWRDGADIVIEPFDRLTDADRRALKTWKSDALALIDYVPEAVQ
jgi:hypothetical protein